MDLVVETYNLTEKFPKSETYGLVSQMRRAAVSIPSNIAEGYQRNHLAEYIQFLSVAYSSGAELETQIEICKRLPQLKDLEHKKIDLIVSEVMRLLNSILAKLKSKR